jgi:type I restriction enzyme S subunit
MADEWCESTIGALCDAGVAELQTGPFGSQLHAYDYVTDGVPVVPTEAIRARRIDHSVLPRISPAKAQELARHRLQPGDILFARRGVQATGHIGYIREAEDGFICGTGAIRLRINHERGEVEADFLSHVLANPASIEWFKFHAIGATMPNLNEGIIRSFPLAIPPLPEQRAIAHILGTLDDKIELSRRMNETLEAMARALFKSWFVDFDPVRAMAEGRDPGLPKPIADLFPDSFEDSELGEIPKGWEIGTLSDFADLNPETWSKNTAPDEIEYVDLANTKWGKIEQTQRYLWKDAPSRAQRTLRPGDTIVGTVRPGNGSFALITQEGLTGSTGFAVLRPRKAIYEEYTYLAATSSDNIDRLSHLADGAAYPAVRPDVVLITRVILPGDSLLKRFTSVAKPIMAKIASNERESRTLATLRDTLLPKLISGELRVKDAERFIGRVISLDRLDLPAS